MFLLLRNAKRACHMCRSMCKSIKTIYQIKCVINTRAKKICSIVSFSVRLFPIFINHFSCQHPAQNLSKRTSFLTLPKTRKITYCTVASTANEMGPGSEFCGRHQVSAGATGNAGNWKCVHDEQCKFPQK